MKKEIKYLPLILNAGFTTVVLVLSIVNVVRTPKPPPELDALFYIFYFFLAVLLLTIVTLVWFVVMLHNTKSKLESIKTTIINFSPLLFMGFLYWLYCTLTP